MAVITVEGNSSKPKLLGRWISWSVIQSGGDALSPGRGNERLADTKDLPDVAAAYQAADGAPGDPDYLHQPGKLILEDPRDDWHFDIVTGQEDSEVLYADAATMLYRINDAIYQVDLQGGTPGGLPRLIVKDVDVPEVHWASSRLPGESRCASSLASTCPISAIALSRCASVSETVFTCCSQSS